MAKSANNLNTDASVSGPRLTRADLVLWLPGRAVVRREVLHFSREDQRFELRPDGSPAGISLRIREDRFHAMLSGPERADVEVEFTVEDPRGLSLPLWALVHGREAEVSVWDAFGRLAVPDVTARGADAAPLNLPMGRYTMTASALGSTTLVIGAGCDVEAACLELGGRRAVAG
ncbi:MAG: hypothetical protein EBQ99_04290 [Planctomycetes bacterium]|nr:hypothetical protein [Planctomycetota bacterium]